MLREDPNPKYDNFVAGSVSVGARANVAAGTMVGADSALEDRTSVKRSVVGQGCHLGAGSKVGGGAGGRGGQRGAEQSAGGCLGGRQRMAAAVVLPAAGRALTRPPSACPALPCPARAPVQVVNSVLMDDVRLGANCAVHGCIISAGCSLGEGVRLRDCHLAPGYAVPAGAELTEEVLPPPPYKE